MSLNLVVSVDNDSGVRVSEVVMAAEKLGFKVTACFEDLGVFTGALEDENKLSELRSVKGVKHVEPERTYRIQ